MPANEQDSPSKLVKTQQQLKKAKARVAELEAQLIENQPPHTPIQNEDHYYRAFDSLLEGAEIIGFDWHYVYVNDAVVGHGRQPKEVLLRSTVIELYPGIENTDMFARLRTCMEERTPQHFESEFMFPDGETTWFELTVQPVPEGIFILSLDITERKRTEAALKNYAKRMEILHTIDIGIISADSIQSVVETALKQVRQIVPCQRNDVIIIDEAAGDAVIFAIGLDSDTKLGQGVRVPIPPNVFEGYDARNLRIFDDIRRFQDTRPRARQLVNEGLLCALSALLMDRGRPIGVLGFFADTPSFFTAEHQEIAVEIANQL
ncbi:MAG: PAS domain-containing protein, partial [Chloroflexota bacterium]